MITVRIIWLLLCTVWITAEIKLARPNRIEDVNILEKEERSQRVLWLTMLVSLILALIFKTIALAPIPIGYLPRQIIGLLIFANGLGLRYVAVKQLGRLFTTDVSIYTNHQLIVAGPYRWVRHPAYTGLIIAFAGAGLAMGDFIALAILTIPVTVAFNYRITIEESFLVKKFGKDYQEYRQQTKKLLPSLRGRKPSSPQKR